MYIRKKYIHIQLFPNISFELFQNYMLAFPKSKLKEYSNMYMKPKFTIHH